MTTTSRDRRQRAGESSPRPNRVALCSKRPAVVRSAPASSARRAAQLGDRVEGESVETNRESDDRAA
ncbi:MAG: hypothetical protein ACFB9N_08025 [Geitlerinemataceae cyanobacterium]